MGQGLFFQPKIYCLNELFLVKLWNSDIQKNKTKIIKRIQDGMKNLINIWPTILLCCIVSHDKQMKKKQNLKKINI